MEPTLKAQGLAPNAGDPYTPPYSIPTLRFDADTIVMDSKKIAIELEKRHPSPSMHLDSPVLLNVEQAFPGAIMPLLPIMLPMIPRKMLNSASVAYYEKARSKDLGMPLEQLEREKGGEDAWLQARPGIENLASLLKQTDGPYFMGNMVSYADFMIVAMLQSMKRLDESVFQRFVSHDEVLVQLFQACEQWLQRDT